MITVDDLIIVNMMFKFKHRYESNFLALKFMEFLCSFESSSNFISTRFKFKN